MIFLPFKKYKKLNQIKINKNIHIRVLILTLQLSTAFFLLSIPYSSFVLSFIKKLVMYVTEPDPYAVSLQFPSLSIVNPNRHKAHLELSKGSQ